MLLFKWLKIIASILFDAGLKFNKDCCQRYAAALSYYTVFSLAPLLIILVAVLSLWFGEDADARVQLVQSVEEIAGSQISATINNLILSATRPVQGILASSIALITFLVGASRILVELRSVLNIIWGFAQEQAEVDLTIFKQVIQIILIRLFTIFMILVIGATLLGLMLVSAYFSIANAWLAANTTDVIPISRFLDPLFTILGLTGFFYIIMRFLPAHRPPRRFVLCGALVAATLFNLGKTVISIYLAKTVATSAYGAASSLVVLMLWIYLSSWIFLYGAQLSATLQLRRLKAEKDKLTSRHQPEK